MKPQREAVIYRRVSTKKQDDKGKSLEDQDTELEAYCRIAGYAIIGNFSDTISGRRRKTGKRKGFQAAITLCCERKATLVVYALDRLARSQSAGLLAIERLQDAGAHVVIKNLGIDTGTPAGKAIIGMMLLFAEFTSDYIGERVKMANGHTIRRRGYRTQGAQPFGWRIVDGELKPIPEEQELLATLRDYWERNGKIWYRTAVALNADGIPTPEMVRFGRPGKWFAATVRTLILRKSPLVDAE